MRCDQNINFPAHQVKKKARVHLLQRPRLANENVYLYIMSDLVPPILVDYTRCEIHVSREKAVANTCKLGLASSRAQLLRSRMISQMFDVVLVKITDFSSYIADFGIKFGS